MHIQSRPQFDQPDQFVSTAAPTLSLRQRIAVTLTLWRQRTKIRRRLAEMDSRSLRDVGISPAAAAYESGKPFWQKMGCLR